MTQFHYKAMAADGKPRTGTLAGESPKHVAAELKRQGLIPVFVGDAPQRGFSLKLAAGKRTGNARDVLFFTQELSTLLNAGVPLDRALSITAELSERPAFKPVILDVLRALKGGRSLADSLATHPECFGDLYANMVRAGEASGQLGLVFERLAEFNRTRDELRSYVVSALVYPALLALVGMGSIFILLYYVVPRFAAVFSDPKMKIPAATQMLLVVSAYVQSYGLFVLAAVAVAVLALRFYVRTEAGRWWWDGMILKTPLYGDAARKAETSRFARAMGTLVTASVPLVQSIGIARAILSNRRMAASLEAVAQGVKRGEGLATPLARSGQFPPLASHLLSIGEETGRLDMMFARMAEIYEADTKTAIKRFTALFEPVIILVMGVIVGALILSMLLAITSINEVAV